MAIKEQVEFSLKVILKCWDVAIYENVRQMSLTQTVSEISLFLHSTCICFLYFGIIGVECASKRKRVRSQRPIEWNKLLLMKVSLLKG